jgi:hypothetical protein
MRGGLLLRCGLVCAFALALPDMALAGKHKAAAASAPASTPAPVAAQEKLPDADTLLLGVYRELAANHLRAAMEKADALVAAYPNFHLGHLIRGDLLLMHARPAFGLD